MIRYVVPIVIGAIIGYCTNYIAIKMLFRPRKEKRIAGIKLPFTPGIIPRNKGRIARAVGNAVGGELFTADDLKDTLLSGQVREMVVKSISGAITDESTIGERLSACMGAEEYEACNERIYGVLCEKIEDGIRQADISAIITTESREVIMQKVQGSMMAMFVNEDMINSILEPIGQKIDQYIDEHGQEKIMPIVEKELGNIENATVMHVLNTIGVDSSEIDDTIAGLYDRIVSEKAADIIGKVDIASVVENKMNEMDVDEIEQLVMSVMKNELQAVINLGALIGAVIGALNILF